MTNTNKPEVSAGALDVIKLAQRCGASQLLYLSGDSVPSYTLVGNAQLQAFANAVLEEAAKECDYVTKNARPSMTMSAYQTGAINCATAIRGMKG